MIDMTGKRCGRLTVVGLDHIKYEGIHKRPYWNVVCDCGKSKIIDARSLRSGTRSCGCLRSELARERSYKGYEHRKLLYGVLKMALERCYEPSSKFYRNYGARGITVCDEWRGNSGLDNFVRWASQNGYKPGLTLDRIDNDKGYSPENCQWATRKWQSNNKRNNVYITIDGETKTLAQWCEHYNVPYARVEARLKSMGWSIEDALFTPRYKKPISGRDYGKHSNCTVTG